MWRRITIPTSLCRSQSGHRRILGAQCRRRGIYLFTIGIFIAGMILIRSGMILIRSVGNLFPDKMLLLQNRSVKEQNTSYTRLGWEDMPNDPRIEFIHVGKAGGFSITMSVYYGPYRKRGEIKCIGAKLRAGDEDIKSCNTSRAGDSQIFNHTVGRYHMTGPAMSQDEKEWLLNTSNTFLFSVREPIDRIISTYNYHREEYTKSNYTKYKRFYECFPSGLNDMVNMMRRNNDTERPCTVLGENVLKGKTAGGGEHFQLNYNYYHDYTIGNYPNYSVSVIRTERMWDDITKLEQALGGLGEFKNAGLKHTHGSEKYVVPYDAKLSAPNTKYLCCLIHDDIEIYQQLILKSFNLDGLQKHESLSNLMTRCLINETEVEGRDLLVESFSWKAYSQSSICNSTKILQ